MRIFQRSQENVCKEYHFRLDIMIEIGGEEEGGQEREGRPVRAVCLGRGLASRNYKEREAFRTRTPSFCCVCPSRALEKSLLPRCPHILITTNQHPALVMTFNLRAYCVPLLCGHFLCPCDLPRQTSSCMMSKTRASPYLRLHSFLCLNTVFRMVPCHWALSRSGI